MAVRLSRRKITGHIADQLALGKPAKKLIRELAAYLVSARRTKELDLIVRDIEYELTKRGIVLARVTTAFDLQAATRSAVTKLIKERTNAKTIELEQYIDPAVLGGFKIDLPGLKMDATIAHRLNVLRTSLKK
jgi:F0F1-type ATP synthase delta subunit